MSPKSPNWPLCEKCLFLPAGSGLNGFTGWTGLGLTRLRSCDGLKLKPVGLRTGTPVCGVQVLDLVNPPPVCSSPAGKVGENSETEGVCGFRAVPCQQDFTDQLDLFKLNGLSTDTWVTPAHVGSHVCSRPVGGASDWGHGGQSDLHDSRSTSMSTSNCTSWSPSTSTLQNSLCLCPSPGPGPVWMFQRVLVLLGLGLRPVQSGLTGHFGSSSHMNSALKAAANTWKSFLWMNSALLRGCSLTFPPQFQ